MLVDRYDPLNLFARIPSLGMQMEPVLAQIDQLLDQDAIFQAVKADLAKRYPHTLTVGRRRRVNLRAVLNAIGYKLKTKCQASLVAARTLLSTRRSCHPAARHAPTA